MTPAGVAAFHRYLAMYRAYMHNYREDHAVHGVRYEAVSGIGFCPICKTVWTPEGGVEVVEDLA